MHETDSRGLRNGKEEDVGLQRRTLKLMRITQRLHSASAQLRGAEGAGSRRQCRMRPSEHPHPLGHPTPPLSTTAAAVLQDTLYPAQEGTGSRPVAWLMDKG